ncbi:putative transcriptional regulator [Propionibacteriaceae bacterium ES.041]|nr:putative transcriptional regulator [Propionibacteriaceae bacterium ES.041]
MTLLGELEAKVMEVLWHAPEPMSVRQVHTVLAADRDLAYTTVMTVLDRLAKKEIVQRERDGRQWLYQPMTNRGALIADEILELVTGAADERRAVYVELVRRMPAADRTALAKELSAN